MSMCWVPPLFKKATLHLENGQTLVIKAPENGEGRPYVESLLQDGTPYTKNYLRHADLLKGGKLLFQMSDTPNLHRGTARKDRPYSFSGEEGF